MSNPVDVCWCTNAMVGHTALSGQPGKLIDVLDAFLLTGFGSKDVTPLIVASGVATATVSGGHDFLDHVVVEMANASPSGLNGKKRITVVNSTTFTFDATGISDQTATTSSTITAKMAPPGSWEKAFSDTNKAAYHSTAIGSTGHYLRVDDSNAQVTALTMYETMSDVDTGTGSSGLVYHTKSSSANATENEWILVGDSQLFYLLSSAGNDGEITSALCFGDIVSYKSPDPYACVIVGQSSGVTYVPYLQDFASTSASILSRSHTGYESAIGMSRYSHGKTATRAGYQGGSYPNPVDDSAYFWPIDSWESAGPRGMMPGLWNPIHSANITHKTIITAIPELAGRSLLVSNCYSSYAQLGFDITGPWRE